jgi:hypothetical protein
MDKTIPPADCLKSDEIPALGSVNKEQLASQGEQLQAYFDSNDLENDEYYFVATVIVAIENLVTFWNKQDEKIEISEEG